MVFDVDSALYALLVALIMLILGWLTVDELVAITIIGGFCLQGFKRFLKSVWRFITTGYFDKPIK